MNLPLLSLDNITLAYEQRIVLHNFSLTVSEKDFIILRGKNGSGKSSLLKLMAGLLPPHSGQMQKVEKLRIGYLPQYRQTDRNFPITVFDTVLSGLQSQLRWWQQYRATHRSATTEILKKMDILDLAERPIAELSGGQWQRTLLARALVSNPQLLLLDEPDAHLDTHSRTALYNTLHTEQNLRSIVLVSHDETLPHFEQARTIQLG